MGHLELEQQCAPSGFIYAARIKQQVSNFQSRCHGNLSGLSRICVQPWWRGAKSWALFRRFRISLRWRHNGHDGVSNHQPHHYLLNRLFGCRSKKTSKPRVTGLCAGNSPGTGEFPAQMASNAENVSIWWRHHVNMMTTWHGNAFRITAYYLRHHEDHVK